MNVSMNAHGVAVERELGRPSCRSLHARLERWGRFLAAVIACAAAAGVDPRLESLLVGSALGWRWMRHGAWGPPRRFAEGASCPRAPWLLSRCLAFLDDDGGRDRRLERHLPPHSDRARAAAAAATAFTGFSLGMAVARLGGDSSMTRLGAPTLDPRGMALVALALGCVLLIGETGPQCSALPSAASGSQTPSRSSSRRRRLAPPGPSLAATFTHRLHRLHRRPAADRPLADRGGGCQASRCSSWRRSP